LVQNNLKSGRLFEADLAAAAAAAKSFKSTLNSPKVEVFQFCKSALISPETLCFET
jgi:hypothetical protein